MMFYEEINRIPFTRNYDVIIVGGGIGGVSAAIASARAGVQTLIIEKSICLGGQATLGHVVKYEPLCDGHGKQLIGGISAELMKKSILYGFDNLPCEWKERLGIVDEKTYDDEMSEYMNKERRCATFFNIPAFVLALDEMMEQEGIDVLFDTVFCAPIMNDNNCMGIIVENKSGREAYRAKMVIDASGDADVMYRCGAVCKETDNFITYMCYDIDFKRMQDAISHKNMYRAIPSWRMLGYNPLDYSGKSAVKYYGTSVEQVNGFIKESRRSALNYLKKNLRDDYMMISVPAIPAFRTTRRIVGLYELSELDDHKIFEDSIGITGDWRKVGPIFEIPYRSLIDAKIPNVAAVGRIIASGGDAWEITRCIPQAAITGEAAGTAVSIAIKDNCRLQEINVQKLQRTLEHNGVILHA